MKKLYYTVHPNFYSREINVYEIIDNNPKLICTAEGETQEDTDSDDKRVASECLREELNLSETDYTLMKL